MSDTKEPNYSADDYALDHDLFFNERPPMPDRDAAFREALDALVAFVRVDERERTRHSGERNGVLIACARVLALYAEAQQQGERDQLALAEQVAEATMRMEQGRAERLTAGETGRLVPLNDDGAILYIPDGGYSPLVDDRVRVTRVEEGT